MGGKSRKSGGISKALVQRLARKYQQERKAQSDEQISTDGRKSQSKSQLLDE
jgi:hypothetical protein